MMLNQPRSPPLTVKINSMLYMYIGKRKKLYIYVPKVCARQDEKNQKKEWNDDDTDRSTMKAAAVRGWKRERCEGSSEWIKRTITIVDPIQQMWR